MGPIASQNLAVLLLLVASCGRVGYTDVHLAEGGPDTGSRDSAALDSAARDSAVDGARDSAGAVDGGAGDVGPGVDAAACPEAPCRLLAPQCGCTTGQGCVESGGMRSCAPVGTVGPGDVCSGPADCAAALHCIHWGDRPYPGVCRELCADDGHCLTSGRCLEAVSGGTTGSCGFDCNPLTDAGCPPPLRCYAFPVLLQATAEAVIGTTCAMAAGAAAGTTCARARECGPGTTCVMGETEGTCRTLCTTEVECPGAPTCQPLGLVYDVGGLPLGACI